MPTLPHPIPYQAASVPSACASAVLCPTRSTPGSSPFAGSARCRCGWPEPVAAPHRALRRAETAGVLWGRSSTSVDVADRYQTIWSGRAKTIRLLQSRARTVSMRGAIRSSAVSAVPVRQECGAFQCARTIHAIGRQTPSRHGVPTKCVTRWRVHLAAQRPHRNPFGAIGSWRARRDAERFHLSRSTLSRTINRDRPAYADGLRANADRRLARAQLRADCATPCPMTVGPASAATGRRYRPTQPDAALLHCGGRARRRSAARRRDGRKACIVTPGLAEQPAIAAARNAGVVVVLAIGQHQRSGVHLRTSTKTGSQIARLFSWPSGAR